jgi:hypothetical protein
LKKRNVDNLCPICGIEMDAVCTGYRSTKFPFVDGRTYEAICDCCHTIPKTCEFINNEWKYYNYYEQQLHTIEEIMDGGWSKDQAKRSLKGVKAKIKKGKVIDKI